MTKRPSKSKVCASCSGPISYGSRTGLCRPCSKSDPTILARRAEGIRKAHQTRPEVREAARKRMAELNRTPEMRARSGRFASERRLWEIGLPLVTPEVRARQARTYSERRLADIPPELRDLHRELVKRGGLTAAESREVIRAEQERRLDKFRRSLKKRN